MLDVFLAALAAIPAAAPMPAEAQRPIRLEVDREGDFLDIKVLGVAPPAADARFELEVASGGTGGTTKTVQAGANRAGQIGGTLLNSRIRVSQLAQWSARLSVTIGDQHYEMREPG